MLAYHQNLEQWNNVSAILDFLVSDQLKIQFKGKIVIQNHEIFE